MWNQSPLWHFPTSNLLEIVWAIDRYSSVWKIHNITKINSDFWDDPLFCRGLSTVNRIRCKKQLNTLIMSNNIYFEIFCLQKQSQSFTNSLLKHLLFEDTGWMSYHLKLHWNILEIGNFQIFRDFKFLIHNWYLWLTLWGYLKSLENTLFYWMLIRKRRRPTVLKGLRSHTRKLFRKFNCSNYKLVPLSIM